MKRLMLILMALLMIALSLPAFADSAVEPSAVSSARWSLNNDILKIEGVGRAPDFPRGSAPWRNYEDHVKKVFVSEGITSLGNYSFYGCYALKKVYLPRSVESIGTGAFSGCPRDMVIYCDKNSYAARYARQNGIKYSNKFPIEVEKKMTLWPGNIVDIDAKQDMILGRTSTLTFKSDNKKIATVTSNGTVTAKKSGKCNIRVTSSHGEKVTIKLTVKSVPIDVGSKNVTIPVGTTYTIHPEQTGTSGAVYTYKSSKTRVATVDAAGVVRARSVGSSTITVKSSFGQSVKVKVTVTEGMIL